MSFGSPEKSAKQAKIPIKGVIMLPFFILLLRENGLTDTFVSVF